jgi:GT2 family glycosyltransferase
MSLVDHYPAVNRPVEPVCSICIANYNGDAFLRDCLESVFAQQGNITFEIIVHDDASTDDSVKLLREKYPQVELLASQENVGFCISNNRMVEHARGEFILLLNNDATLYSDALISLLSAAHAQTTVGILTLPQYDWETGALVDRGCLLDPFYNPVPNLDPARKDVALVIGACLWIPRVLWDVLGGFPEWFGSIGEDLYLCCRARLSGHPVRVLGVSGYRHRVGSSFGGGKARDGKLATTFRRRALSERNKTFVMVMTCPAPIMQLWLPVHLLLLLVEGVMLAMLRGQRAYLSEIYLPVFRALFKNRRLLLKQRKTIMQQRSIRWRDFFSVFRLMPYKLSMLFRHGLPQVK